MTGNTWEWARPTEHCMGTFLVDSLWSRWRWSWWSWWSWRQLPSWPQLDENENSGIFHCKLTHGDGGDGSDGVGDRGDGGGDDGDGGGGDSGGGDSQIPQACMYLAR